MGNNLLSEGNTRMGWLIDGDPETPDIAVMLQDTGKQIVLTVPTKGMLDADGPYSRWFSSGIQFADDPDRTRYQYAPPRVLMFTDNDGPVVLVGCRDMGFKSAFDAGHGKIVANFAVLGGRNLRYEKLNGLRSEIPALAAWTGLRSVHIERETDGVGRTRKVHVKLDSPPRTPVSSRMNLALKPTWRTSFPDNVGTFAAHDVVQLETTSKRNATWDSHLELHVAIRDLLALAAWNPFGFSHLEVNRTDDPERFINGEFIQPRWASVATYRLRKHQDWVQSHVFCLRSGILGRKGSVNG